MRGHFLACTAGPDSTVASNHLYAHQNTAPGYPLQAGVVTFVLPTSMGGGAISPPDPKALNPQPSTRNPQP